MLSTSLRTIGYMGEARHPRRPLCGVLCSNRTSRTAPREPLAIGFAMVETQILVIADMERMPWADRLIAGFAVADFPIAKQLAMPRASGRGAFLSALPHAAHDGSEAVNDDGVAGHANASEDERSRKSRSA
jgi:hypothetical protein